jgi:phospholipid-binding lipoprotein MlaA
VIVAVALSLTAWLSGCAKPPPASDPEALAEFRETNDPLEPTNRVFYKVNNALDVVLLRPLAVGYTKLPQQVQTHTHDVLANLGQPVVLFNDMLEGKPRRAGDTFMRFLLNSTLGIAGLFDVATGWGWPAHDADFGLTLAVWGVSDGPYLYLPVLGPSGPRDAAGFGTDIVLDPFTWIGQGYIVSDLGYARFGASAIDTRAQLLDPIDKVKAQALDPYATFRSLYRQHRQSQLDDIRSDTRATVPNWFPHAASNAADASAGGAAPASTSSGSSQ